jgi:hypothetical protein
VRPVRVVREPPLRVRVPRKITRGEGLLVRRGAAIRGEYGDRADQTHARAARTRLGVGDRQGRGVVRRVEDVLRVPRDGEKEQCERAVGMARCIVLLQRKRGAFGEREMYTIGRMVSTLGMLLLSPWLYD